MSEDTTLSVIGRSSYVSFPELELQHIPARVDTGAKTSAIWASGVVEEQGVLQCVLFGPDSPLYTGEVLRFETYTTKSVKSSNGLSDERYVVQLLVVVNDHRVLSSFTLANRSKQKFPILIGRNILRGKFIVNVQQVHTLAVDPGNQEQTTKPKGETV
jgi:hypothetical protein